MPRKPIKFELDFMIKDIFPRFTVKQFDDVSFNIKPLNQGLDYDTSNMIGKIFVGVNDDMFMQTTDITVSSNNINVLLDKNMLQKNGRAYAEIELTDEAGTITSSSFIFDIDPKIGEGGMIPGEYEGFVEKYERLISEFKAQINSTIDNSNSLIDKTIKNCNTSVDNKLNTVDSLVNTKITNINNTLNKKVSEVDSKLDTVDGLITAKVSDFERRFSALTSSQQQNSEVIDAREGEVSLKSRLDKDIENPKKLYTYIEGTEISVDSLEGYLKDIEILGNTVQDQDNLADIRSVGDKLENQELYEIPVLSRGKNILNVNRMELGHINWINGLDIPDNNRLRSSFISIPSQAKALFATNEYGLSVIKGIVYYDKNKTYISCQTDDSSFTVPDTAKYIRVILEISADTDICISNEEVYEPYIEDKLTILSPIQLEKVGDVADRIICKDGVWGIEKNIARGVIETIGSVIDNRENFTGVSITIPNIQYQNRGNVITLEGFATFTESDLTTIPIYSIYCNTSNLVACFPKGTSPTDMRAHLIGRNYICITTQPQFIPLPHDQQIKLRTFANKTNIHFECEIEPTLKASVPKSLGASVSSNTEQIDILHRELDKIKKLLLQSEVVF